MPATAPWLASVEAMLNRSIDGSSEAAALVNRLDSTCLQIEVEGITHVRVATHGGHLSLLAGEHDAKGGQPAADAVISGSPSALLALLQGARPTGAKERSAVNVLGNAEIANLYRQLFSAARPDPEEELSRWIGDAPARGMSRLAGGILSWARRTRRIAGENIAEYLVEEGRDLAARTEVEEFLQGVDELREAADRVEARLKNLERLQGRV